MGTFGLKTILRVTVTSEDYVLRTIRKMIKCLVTERLHNIILFILSSIIIAKNDGIVYFLANTIAEK